MQEVMDGQGWLGLPGEKGQRQKGGLQTGQKHMEQSLHHLTKKENGGKCSCPLEDLGMVREYALGENTTITPKHCPLSILTQSPCLGLGI